MSAVASVSTSGVFPTGILRLVAAARSTLSTPTAQLLITFRRRRGGNEFRINGVGEQREKTFHVPCSSEHFSSRGRCL